MRLTATCSKCGGSAALKEHTDHYYHKTKEGFISDYICSNCGRKFLRTDIKSSLGMTLLGPFLAIAMFIIPMDEPFDISNGWHLVGALFMLCLGGGLFLLGFIELLDRIKCYLHWKRFY